MPQSKEVHREYMRNKRKGSQIIKGSHGVHTIEVDTKTAAKLLLICRSCDKEIHTLSGKRENILTMIRYGIGGPTLESIKAQLEG